MPNSSRYKTGKAGEDIAAAYLIQCGYVLKARNYRVREGEIDIVAQKPDVLVFVEVKTAKSRSFGAPESWVDERKQQRIGLAAERYLMEKEIEDLDCRFDVITVDLAVQPPFINHIEDAFWLDE